MLTKYALVAIIVLCCTVLGFTLMVGDSLCELSIRERGMEFVVWSLRQFSLTNRRSSHHAGVKPISANLRVEPSEERDASVPR